MTAQAEPRRMTKAELWEAFPTLAGVLRYILHECPLADLPDAKDLVASIARAIADDTPEGSVPGIPEAASLGAELAPDPQGLAFSCRGALRQLPVATAEKESGEQ